jgi:hypothetical protein
VGKCLWPCFAQELHEKSSRREFLKSFTQRPPIISNLIFHEKDYLRKAAPDTWVLARIQPNGIFLREADSPDLLRSNAHYPMRRLIGHFGSNYWYYGLAGHDLTSWTDDGSQRKDRTNSAYYSSRVAEDIISEVLNVGVRNAKVGSLRWARDNFECTSDMTGATMRGSLIVTNGTPAELRYLLSSKDSNVYPYTVSLGYTKDLGIPFPDSIRVYSEKEHKRVLLRECEIVKLETSEAALPGRDFGPERFFSANSMVPLIQTKDGPVDARNGNLLEKHEPTR